MFRIVLAAALAGLVAGCGSSATKVDKGGVTSIKSVALVAFSVPRIVAEEAGGGSLAGISAAVATIRGGGMRGNGAEVAREAAGGFVDEMNKDGTLRFVATSQVVASGDFKSLAGTYDQSKGQGNQKAAYEGLPVIVLTPSMAQSDFAARAAKALGVDGVVLVDINKLNYFLYTGAMGSGQAKARGSALFKLFDRNGRAVWESGAVVYTEASGGMVAGGISPAAAPVLNRDIGTTIAKDLLKTYRGS